MIHRKSNRPRPRQPGTTRVAPKTGMSSSSTSAVRTPRQPSSPPCLDSRTSANQSQITSFKYGYSNIASPRGISRVSPVESATHGAPTQKRTQAYTASAVEEGEPPLAIVEDNSSSNNSESRAATAIGTEISRVDKQDDVGVEAAARTTDLRELDSHSASSYQQTSFRGDGEQDDAEGRQEDDEHKDEETGHEEGGAEETEEEDDEQETSDDDDDDGDEKASDDDDDDDDGDDDDDDDNFEVAAYNSNEEEEQSNDHDGVEHEDVDDGNSTRARIDTKTPKLDRHVAHVDAADRRHAPSATIDARNAPTGVSVSDFSLVRKSNEQRKVSATCMQLWCL